MAGEAIAGIENGELSLLLKGGRVIAEFVQQHAQSPDIRLLINRLLPINVHHFRASVLQRSVLLHVFFYKATLDSCRRCGSWLSSGSEIADLEPFARRRRRYQDVFDFEIAMKQRWLEVMHASNSFGNIGEDFEDLGLCQPVVQSRVHKINQTTAVAIFHEQKHLISAPAKLRGVGVHVRNNGSVALEPLHRLDLGPHVAQSIFVRYGHALQHGKIGPPDGLRQLDQIDMGETTLGEIFLDHDPVAADLDLGSRVKSTLRGGGTGHGYLGTSMMAWPSRSLRRVLTIRSHLRRFWGTIRGGKPTGRLCASSRKATVGRKFRESRSEGPCEA